MWSCALILLVSVVYLWKDTVIADGSREQQPVQQNYDGLQDKMNWRLQTDQFNTPLHTERTSDDRLYKIFQLKHSKPIFPTNPTNLATNANAPRQFLTSGSSVTNIDPLTLASIIALSQRQLPKTNSAPNTKQEFGEPLNHAEYTPTGSIQKQRPSTAFWQLPNLSASVLYQHLYEQQPYINVNSQYPFNAAIPIHDYGIVNGPAFDNVESLDQSIEEPEVSIK